MERYVVIKMKFHVLTLFPEMVIQGLNTSIIGRAMEKNLLTIDAVNIRDYTLDKHGKVDDYPYGGGAGMLMQAQPVYDAHKAISNGRKIRTIYVTPQGRPFNQKLVSDFAKEEELIFLCGHYEGIDERVLEEVVTDYVSIGDYVLTGGELPAMVMIDAISRLIPGVLNNDVSAETESFHNDLLEYPQYSRPEVWMDKKVPDVLLSGNHKNIVKWRLEQSEERTKRIRPDLYKKYVKKQKLIAKLSKKKRKNIHIMEALGRGLADILYESGDNFIVYYHECKCVILQADNTEQAGKMIEYIPTDAASLIITQEELIDMLCEQCDMRVLLECKQVCYTKREVLPVRHKDIRLLSLDALPYLVANYEHDCEEYLRGRILANVMYGAYVEERLVGFVGMHDDGSMGMLYVDEAYRGKGLAVALESYIINRQLEQGFTPYCQVIVGNEASRRLQEKLGLYISEESVWWLG